jgi:hypothetical protein
MSIRADPLREKRSCTLCVSTSIFDFNGRAVRHGRRDGAQIVKCELCGVALDKICAQNSQYKRRFAQLFGQNEAFALARRAGI